MDLEKVIEELQKCADRITASKEASREFLVKVGVFTPEGKLTEKHGPFG